MAKRTVVNGAVVEEIPLDASKTNEQLEREAAAPPPLAPAAAAAAAGPAYTLKGVKTFRGMDGHGLNATLCRDGKPVCDLVDEGSGGMMFFRWLDQRHGESKEEGLFKAFIEGERARIPADKRDEFQMLEREIFDGEHWVNALVDRMANDRRMRRMCKTKTCYQVGDQIGGDEFYATKGVGPELRAAIERKHAGKPVKFLNDEYAE